MHMYGFVDIASATFRIGGAPTLTELPNLQNRQTKVAAFGPEFLHRKTVSVICNVEKRGLNPGLVD